MIFKNSRPSANKTPLHATVQGFNWHLRSEQTSDQLKGILVINGVKVLYLNQTAFSYLQTFLQSGQNQRRTIWQAVLREGISPQKARQDWQNLYQNLLQASHGCCEGTDIQVLTEERHFTAPLRVDLALTYRCNNDCTHCYAGGHRETPELTTQQWQQIIDKLHHAGVPQVIFTGGESLLRKDLEQLVAHAKEKKMITGLITNGRLLTKERVQRLAKAGLDFVQITVESTDSKIHNQMVGLEKAAYDALSETLQGVQNALDSSLRVTTNTTITQVNATTVLPTLEELIDLGVERVGINGIIRSHRGKTTSGINSKEMAMILREVHNLCLAQGAEMIWFTPTCYQELNPITLELGVKRCSAASIVLTIEPNGRVMPCQSYFQGLGNALEDDFSEIWYHPLAINLREREWASPGCKKCDYFTSCGGGCPLENNSEKINV